MPASVDPHADQPVLNHGAPLASARAVVLLIHGRGAAADDIIRLARHLPQDGVCYLAPQAADNEWYPQRFLSPLASNEPHLRSALAVFGNLLGRARNAGLPRERILLGGFSQGACLALETAVRNGGRFGGIFALAGAVIGPPGAARRHDRRLDGTPVFLGCGDIDAHIPLASVQETERVLTGLGATVEMRIYEGLGHTIVSDQLDRAAVLVQQVLDSAA
jgi:predicted esterase